MVKDKGRQRQGMVQRGGAGDPRVSVQQREVRVGLGPLIWGSMGSYLYSAYKVFDKMAKRDLNLKFGKLNLGCGAQII